MYIISGFVLFLFWLTAMNMWHGLLGVFLAFVLFPALAIFPIIFWLVEKVFPLNYFIIWGLGLLGLIIAGVSGVGEERD